MQSHSLSISFPICRICHGGEQSSAYDKSTAGEPLISPCSCRGTIGLCHRSCLERWLASTNTSVCEICHFTYQIGRRYRTFCEFVGNRDCHAERRNLVTDITCFVFLTPIVIGCITLCIFSSATQTSGFRLWNNTTGFQAISLLLLSMLLSITYIVWLTVTITYHIKTYFDWRVLNEKVFLVDQQPTSSSRERAEQVRRHRREKRQTSTMRLWCFDLRAFIHDLRRRNLDASSSVSNVQPGSSTSAVHGRQSSILSNGTLDINYDDFVRHLHSEDGGIRVTSASSHTMASTPVRSETSTHVPMFRYPSSKSLNSQSHSIPYSSNNSSSTSDRSRLCIAPVEQ